MIAEATLVLIAAAVFFAGIHLGIAGTRLRDVIVSAIGERAYLAVFSLASLGGIVWLAMAYNRASVETFTLLWAAEPWWRHAAMGVIALASFFVVLGLATPGPTSVGQEALLDAPEPARGIHRITRHPFLWGVLLWALAHMAVNGDLASVIFFGTFALIALFGPPSIDAKRARKLGERWQAYAARTSNIPFAAILAGRNSLNLREIGVARPLAAVVVYLGLAHAHEALFGVSPFMAG